MMSYGSLLSNLRCWPLCSGDYPVFVLVWPVNAPLSRLLSETSALGSESEYFVVADRA